MKLYIIICSLLLPKSYQYEHGQTQITYHDGDKYGVKTKGVKRIVILGDSLTTGHGSSLALYTSWPGVFNTMMLDLGDYEVINFAFPATISRKTSKTFIEKLRYRIALASQPDIVLNALGGNDSKIGSWDIT